MYFKKTTEKGPKIYAYDIYIMYMHNIPTKFRFERFISKKVHINFWFFWSIIIVHISLYSLSPKKYALNESNFCTEILQKKFPLPKFIFPHFSRKLNN